MTTSEALADHSLRSTTASESATKLLSDFARLLYQQSKEAYMLFNSYSEYYTKLEDSLTNCNTTQTALDAALGQIAVKDSNGVRECLDSLFSADVGTKCDTSGIDLGDVAAYSSVTEYTDLAASTSAVAVPVFAHAATVVDAVMNADLLPPGLVLPATGVDMAASDSVAVIKKIFAWVQGGVMQTQAQVVEKAVAIAKCNGIIAWHKANGIKLGTLELSSGSVATATA